MTPAGPGCHQYLGGGGGPACKPLPRQSLSRPIESVVEREELYQLVIEAKAGSRPAMEQLLLAVQPLLEKHATRYADPSCAAQSTSDLIQAAWLRAWLTGSLLEACVGIKGGSEASFGWLAVDKGPRRLSTLAAPTLSDTRRAWGAVLAPKAFGKGPRPLEAVPAVRLSDVRSSRLRLASASRSTH